MGKLGGTLYIPTRAADRALFEEPTVTLSHFLSCLHQRRVAPFATAATAAMLAALTLGAGTSQAAEPTTVLQGAAVTEANLVEALVPDEAPLRTRSLRVVKDAAPQQAARKPSASLLITFQTNSAELTPQARQQLDVVAQALRNEKLADFTFNVEGHADPRGTQGQNLTLSQQRAESVRRYLVGTHAIGAERLSAVGKGDAEPLNTGNPAAPENRRVTLVTKVAN